MDYAKLKCILKLKTDDAVDEACRFLESRGLRFCVDFGTENAIDKALKIMDAEWGWGPAFEQD